MAYKTILVSVNDVSRAETMINAAAIANAHDVPYKERHESGEVPGVEAATALARHGVKATAEGLAAGDINAGEALLQHVNDLGAELLVMGAYAHSRMREYIFGGATRHVLVHAKVPVLMSH